MKHLQICLKCKSAAKFATNRSEKLLAKVQSRVSLLVYSNLLNEFKIFQNKTSLSIFRHK